MYSDAKSESIEPSFTRIRVKRALLYQNQSQASPPLPESESSEPSFTGIRVKRALLYRNLSQAGPPLLESESSEPSFTGIRVNRALLYQNQRLLFAGRTPKNSFHSTPHITRADQSINLSAFKSVKSCSLGKQKSVGDILPFIGKLLVISVIYATKILLRISELLRLYELKGFKTRTGIANIDHDV